MSVPPVLTLSLLVIRPLAVEVGILPQANGSARVRLDGGSTDILAAVKVSVSLRVCVRVKAPLALRSLVRRVAGGSRGTNTRPGGARPRRMLR